MDPRVMAQRKAAAMARVEAALELLIRKSGYKFEAAGGGSRARGDPLLADLLTLEGVAVR